MSSKRLRCHRLVVAQPLARRSPRCALGFAPKSRIAIVGVVEMRPQPRPAPLPGRAAWIAALIRRCWCISASRVLSRTEHRCRDCRTAPAASSSNIEPHHVQEHHVVACIQNGEVKIGVACRRLAFGPAASSFVKCRLDYRKVGVRPEPRRPVPPPSLPYRAESAIASNSASSWVENSRTRAGEKRRAQNLGHIDPGTWPRHQKTIVLQRAQRLAQAGPRDPRSRSASSRSAGSRSPGRRMPRRINNSIWRTTAEASFSD